MKLKWTVVQVEEEISDGSMLVCQMKEIFFFFFDR